MPLTYISVHGRYPSITRCTISAVTHPPQHKTLHGSSCAWALWQPIAPNAGGKTPSDPHTSYLPPCGFVACPCHGRHPATRRARRAQAGLTAARRRRRRRVQMRRSSKTLADYLEQQPAPLPSRLQVLPAWTAPPARLRLMRALRASATCEWSRVCVAACLYTRVMATCTYPPVHSFQLPAVAGPHTPTRSRGRSASMGAAAQASG
jgi:hypothetical protein